MKYWDTIDGTADRTICRIHDNSLVAQLQQALAGGSADSFLFGSAQGFSSRAAFRFA
jgi:hypothetical protein